MTSSAQHTPFSMAHAPITDAFRIILCLGLMLAAFSASAADMRMDLNDAGDTSASSDSGPAMQTDAAARDGLVAQSAMASYMTVMPYYLIADDDRGKNIDNGTGFILGYGHQITGGLFWEGQAFAGLVETGPGGGTDFYQYGLGLDLVYRFVRDASLSPFILAGVGGIYHDVVPEDASGTNVFANVGIGTLFDPIWTGGLRMRLDARYIYDRFEYNKEDSFGDIRIALGLVVPLGEKVVKNTVVKTKTITKRIPVVDSDGDGVPDRNDDCPNTLPGSLVDSHGCAQDNQKIKLMGVKFQYDKATLTGSAKVILRKVVKALKGQPSMRIQIAGHTDSIASNAYNQALSERRAQSVADFLIAHGIDPDRLTTIGYGETRPIATNATPQGRQKNRRVVFHIISK